MDGHKIIKAMRKAGVSVEGWDESKTKLVMQDLISNVPGYVNQRAHQKIWIVFMKLNL